VWTRWLGLGLVLGAASCSTQTECDKVCRRVARCRTEARVGKKIPGEKDPPADAKCMKRCRDQPEEWQVCEKAKRTCEGLRACFGPLR
jgi:Cys-rich protein (TIGR04453 family)